MNYHDYNYYIFSFRILGLPSKEEWPENAILLWSSFTPQLKKPLEECVREIGPLAKELLTVSLTYKYVHLSVGWELNS